MSDAGDQYQCSGGSLALGRLGKCPYCGDRLDIIAYKGSTYSRCGGDYDHNVLFLRDHHLVFNDKEHSFVLTKQPDIRNSELYRRVEQLANDFFVELDNYMREERHAWSFDIQRAFYDVYSWFLSNFARSKPETTRFRRSASLFDECLSLILHDETMRRVNGIRNTELTEYSHLPFRHDLLELLERLSEEVTLRVRSGMNVFDHERHRVRHLPLSKHYKTLEDYLYDQFRTYRLIAVLDNFSPPKEPIWLDESTIIRSLTLEDSESISRIPWTFLVGRRKEEVDYGNPAMVELTWKESKRPESRVPSQGRYPNIRFLSADALDPYLELPITALRVLKKGDVGYRSVFSIGASPFQKWHPVDVPIECFIPSEDIRPQYELRQSDVNELLEILSDLRRSHSKGLDMGIRRFNLAYTRARTEDRLVDLIIAFETLLIRRRHDKKKQKKGDTISCRTAALLGKSADEHPVLWDMMMTAYRVRNAVVHEGHPAPKDLGAGPGQPVETLMRDLVAQIHDYLRSSIRELSKRLTCSSLQEIHAELDTLLL